MSQAVCVHIYIYVYTHVICGSHFLHEDWKRGKAKCFPQVYTEYLSLTKEFHLPLFIIDPYHIQFPTLQDFKL